jgi:bifunctional DNA-binding transcriptional regulator/antitoxin component of YhaV-PrlF toxin-antitoxin module
VKIIKVSVLNEQGRVTVPVEIRKRWNISKKKAKIAWYNSEDKIFVEVIK